MTPDRADSAFLLLPTGNLEGVSQDNHDDIAVLLEMSWEPGATDSPYTIPLALGLLRPPRRTATRTIV